MSQTLPPQQTDLRWAVELPPEMAAALGAAAGSVAVFRVNEGKLEVEEILPPPSPELRKSVRRTYEKYKEAFEEMKRLGD